MTTPSRVAKDTGHTLAKTRTIQSAEAITVKLAYQPLRVIAEHTAFRQEVAPDIEIPAEQLLPKMSIANMANAIQLYKAGNLTDPAARTVYDKIANHAALAWQTHKDNEPLYQLRKLVRDIFHPREYTELEKVAINHDDHINTYSQMDVATCAYWLEWAWQHWGSK